MILLSIQAIQMIKILFGLSQESRGQLFLGIKHNINWCKTTIT